MTIQVLVDESGIGMDGPVLVFAGVMADAENWALLADEWKQVLDAPPAIKAFKMQKAHGAAMHKKLRALAPIMNAHPFTILYCAVDTSGFTGAFQKRVAEPLSDPYFLPYQTIIASSAWHLFLQGQSEPFEIIFDENPKFGPRARAWYPRARWLLMQPIAPFNLTPPPELARILPVDPMFKNDEDFIALQVADICGWLIQREINGKDHPFGWMKGAIPNVTNSPVSQIFDRERMQGYIDQLSDPLFMANAKRLYDRYQADGGL